MQNYGQHNGRHDWEIMIRGTSSNNRLITSDKININYIDNLDDHLTNDTSTLKEQPWSIKASDYIKKFKEEKK